jgi:hypothetical protein
MPDPKKDDGGDLPKEQPDRTRANIVVAVVMVVLIGAGVWLAHVIANMGRIQDCVLSGRTNCAAIEPSGR